MPTLAPVLLNKIRTCNLDAEILKAAIIAELEAVRLYERLSNLAESKRIRKLLLQIAHEEKLHVSEFMALLCKEDPDRIGESNESAADLVLTIEDGNWISDQGEEKRRSRENTEN
ncbi:MAG: rubrerythrin [Desulfobacteraceae bacterium]|nr:MAG: rubrerythrin [Desulfobacteraceae bacterium]